MLVIVKVGADFSRGCTSKKFGFLLFATRPCPSTKTRAQERVARTYSNADFGSSPDDADILTNGKG